jgi:predicted HAD superfamily Cof-like phosphohydrolase
LNLEPSPTLVDPDFVWIDEPAANLVAKFQVACGHEIRNDLYSATDIGTTEEEMLFGLIAEEFDELADARREGDVIGVIDALQDLKYVIYGYELRLGISGEEHFAEVQDRNMAKVDPVTGKVVRREDGKILKPDGWTQPDHEAVLESIRERGAIYG